MRGTRSLGLALIAAALGAAPALAQQHNGAAPAPNAPANSAPAPSANMAATVTTPPKAPMATNTNGPSGSLEKYNGEWRSSKLVGATVFNSNGDSLGSIDDLLTDDSGKISQAVISTGGVLGMGGKLVEVPFDQLKLEPSATNNAAVPAAGTPNMPAGNNGSAQTTPAASPGPSHPTYYSVVLPNATKDSLSKQQAFKYASTD